jgi:hypothetical protein
MMSSYWVNFATTGDPNGKGLPRWSAVSEKPDTTMQVGDGTRAIPIADSPGKIDFWKQYFARPRTPTGSPTGRAPGQQVSKAWDRFN